MENTDTQTAINALNKARKAENRELETNYVTAAIDALNTLLCSDVTPRLASKITRFRKMLSEYVSANGNQRVIKEMITDGAKDANGNDVYTV